MRGGFYDSETGRELQWPSQMMNKDMDTEMVVYALGDLLDCLLDRNLIDRQDVMDILPQSRWYTLTPPQPSSTPNT